MVSCGRCIWRACAALACAQSHRRRHRPGGLAQLRPAQVDVSPLRRRVRARARPRRASRDIRGVGELSGGGDARRGGGRVPVCRARHGSDAELQGAQSLDVVKSARRAHVRGAHRAERRRRRVSGRAGPRRSGTRPPRARTAQRCVFPLCPGGCGGRSARCAQRGDSGSRAGRRDRRPVGDAASRSLRHPSRQRQPPGSLREDFGILAAAVKRIGREIVASGRLPAAALFQETPQTPPGRA